jgi:hypothetical protein
LIAGMPVAHAPPMLPSPFATVLDA